MGAEVEADMGPVFLEKGFPVLGWLGTDSSTGTLGSHWILVPSSQPQGVSPALSESQSNGALESSWFHLLVLQ